jgi:tetratricopeptide (TPR) repeat protein
MRSRALLVLFFVTGAAAAQIAANQDQFESKVQRSTELDVTFAPAPSGVISASDLGVPARARKEFRKANELIAKHDVKQAIQKLNNAIAIYPDYALAYNNLGVLYSHLGDHVREREALEKAISLNDHFALAYLNLGKMHIGEGDFSAAEKALTQANAFDPTEPATLVLLAYAEFSDGRFDDAIVTSREAHELSGPHALAHRIAARAFLKKGDAEGAIAELKLCLEEEPTGDRAEHARLDLETIQDVLREDAERATR